MEPYPAPGPAGRTTALPLRSRIPPLSLNSAWKSKERRAALRKQWSSVRLAPPAGTSSFFKAELQRGCVRSGIAVLWQFPLLCSLPPLTRLIRPPPNRGPSRFSEPLQPLQLQHIRGSGGDAPATLPPLSAVHSRCIHGGSETGSLVSEPEFDMSKSYWEKNSQMLRGKYKDRNKPRIMSHTGQVQILEKYELRKIHEKQWKLIFTIFNSCYTAVSINAHKK